MLPNNFFLSAAAFNTAYLSRSFNLQRSFDEKKKQQKGSLLYLIPFYLAYSTQFYNGCKQEE